MASLKGKTNKVQDKPGKIKIRNGSGSKKDLIVSPDPPEIGKYVNRIICGDALRALRSMPDRSIDIVITSPPYNFGHAYAQDERDDTLEWNEYFKTLNGIWAECYRVLKPGGRIAVNVQPLFSDYIPTHHVISNQLMALGFLWKAEILWEKNNYNAKYTAWGSWKSPSMPYLKYTWEFIEVFDKETHKKAGARERIDITDTEFKEWVIGKWSFPPEIRMKEYGHPAMFPGGIAETADETLLVPGRILSSTRLMAPGRHHLSRGNWEDALLALKYRRITVNVPSGGYKTRKSSRHLHPATRSPE